MALAAAALLLALTLLAWQLRAGRDPAIGAARAAVATAPATRVLVRRIHRKVIVTDPAVAAPASAPAAAPVPVASRPAAAPVAAAPAPAAPAPAPAPVLATRSS
jgi:2-oxoglutarate dehydrogenase E2 component (dihydrolipoamide succinyltransferase)